MARFLYQLGRSAAIHPWRVITLWLLAALTVIGASSAFGRDLEDSFDAPGLDSSIALELLTEAESVSAGPTAQVVFTPLDGGTVLQDTVAFDATQALEDRVAALPNVLGTSTTISPEGSVGLMQVQYATLDNLSPVDLHNLKAAVAETRAESALQVEAAGELFFTFDEPETGVGEMIGILAAIVILLVAFGSVVAMGLPIGLALFGLALGVSSMPIVTYLVEIPSWAPQIASMVGLGVGIDYALFLVTRHREFLGQGMSISDSAGRAVATAGQAVIFAGGTVVIAILGLAVAGVPFMTAAGVATSVTVLIMVAASVTLLPAFLGLAGPWINRLSVSSLRIGGRRHRSESATNPTIGAGWLRWGAHVSKHAWVYAIGVTMFLLALTAPVLSLELGFPDNGTLPESRTERRAYDLIADGFGPGMNGPLLIAVDLGSNSEPGPDLVDALAAAVADDPGIASVSPWIADGSDVATLVAFPTTSPQDEATVLTIDRLRSKVFPPVLDSSDVTAHVGGQTATFSDIGNRVKDRLPLFIAAVLLASFVLLTLVFRSILVPLKAAILNLLSIGAAYGVLVMVFQWGWGKELIGLESTVPIVAFIPMFMFAILFGLSMDYEVFLLTRVREEYLRTGHNDTSVIHGIASTARVITSAALIMISVFLGFVVSTDPTTKMFGLGLATAIFVDATIVRMVLVPATMKLMGNANWWLPAWLDRILPTVDIDGDTAGFGSAEEPQPALVTVA